MLGGSRGKIKNSFPYLRKEAFDSDRKNFDSISSRYSFADDSAEELLRLDIETLWNRTWDTKVLTREAHQLPRADLDGTCAGPRIEGGGEPGGCPGRRS